MYHVSGYRVIEKQVEFWENEKCCGNTSRTGECFHSFFEFSQTFMIECFFKLIETQRTCFLFLLENTLAKKNETTY